MVDGDDSESLETGAYNAVAGDGSLAGGSALPLDDVLELLANRRRRYALYALMQAQDGSVPLETLFEEVVTLGAAVDGQAVTYDRFADVATDLYHWHLPVLADAGVIDYDARHRTVRYVADRRLETWGRRLRQAELALP